MESPSLNFIDFWPSSVVDLIFQHLTGNEVLNSTLVDRSWNDFLSEQSLTAFKDLWIQPKVGNELIHLVNSNRRYQRIKAVNISTIVDELVEIFEKPGRKWKQIAMFRTTLNTSNDKRSPMEAIIQASAKTVENLELHTLMNETFSEDHPVKSFEFRKLKHLKISYHFLDEGPRWLNGFFSSTPLLESVYLTNACDCAIKNMLLTSRHLKKLSLSGRFQDINFFKDLSEKFGSTLEEFEFNDILSSSYADQNLSYFNNFFQSQSRTLTSFATDALLELEEFETAFKMPNLQTLSVKSFHYNRDQFGQYLENLRESNITSSNLKVFNVQVMDQNLLELLAIYARKLEVLRVDELYISDASNPNWFPELIEVKAFFVTPLLDDIIRLKPETIRSKLEKMIISSIVRPDTQNDLSLEILELLNDDLN